MTHHESPPTNALAVVSLVAALLGLVGMMPLIGSVAAIVSGRMAKREIEAAPNAYQGLQVAQAGIILGWMGVGLFALGICIFLVGVLFFVPVTVVQ